MLKSPGDLKIGFSFLPPGVSCGGGGPGCLYISYRRSLCLFQHGTAEGVLKEWDFFFSAKILSSWCQDQAAIPHPPPRSLVWALPCHGLCWLEFTEQLHVCISDFGSSLCVGGGVRGEWIPGRRCGECLSMCLRGDGVSGSGSSLEHSPKALWLFTYFEKKN